MYVPAEVDGTRVGQRIVEAAAELTGHGAVTGWAALCWMGARWFDGSDGRPVPLAILGNLRPRPGRLVCKEGIDPRDLDRVDGLPVTTAVRSVCFEARHAPDVATAVLALDMAAYSDLVSLEECRVYAQWRLRTWTGVPQLRAALILASENSWAPTESAMRLVWTGSGGMPRPLCNRPVFDTDGRHLGTPDLIDAGLGVVGEYDGKVHLSSARRASDLTREERFRAHGLEPVTMVGADLADPGAFVARLRAAYERASRRPTADCRWTLAQPRWWIPTETVAQRRALSDWDRERLLRHRVAER
ncbi:hypothetical protein [Nocardioides sp. zg-DK7169]|uniref:hypothetical protein n=1 Tax=Nocardioides sp. zg-DK7169 TaxID=2736600 RepID=UPI00155474A2|nr:hypothetical protein [Nocardioides sp. zg-DK7169]NPC98956.1 hypothetical protein [Nocardioides sp. zg-DK7169]